MTRSILIFSTSLSALLLISCGSHGGKASPPPQRSRAMEYRAGLDAYAAQQYRSALLHFLSAAERGNVTAQYYTGLMYSNGQGTPTDYAQAAKWYQQAVQHDQPDAMVQLARLHVMGLGVNLDTSKALELFDRAARTYPAGEDRDRALEQKKALEAVLKEKTS